MMATRMYKLNYSGIVTRPGHRYNTRNHDNIIPTYQRLTKTQRSFSHSGPRIWNTIPLEIRSINTLQKFKRYYKNTLINTYNDTDN